jgi:hypothetical protein
MTEHKDEYWIVEWRYPASIGTPAADWQAVDSLPFRHKKAAEKYPKRSYYEYRLSRFERATEDTSK